MYVSGRYSLTDTQIARARAQAQVTRMAHHADERGRNTKNENGKARTRRKAEADRLGHVITGAPAPLEPQAYFRRRREVHVPLGIPTIFPALAAIVPVHCKNAVRHNPSCRPRQLPIPRSC